MTAAFIVPRENVSTGTDLQQVIRRLNAILEIAGKEPSGDILDYAFRVGEIAAEARMAVSAAKLIRTADPAPALALLEDASEALDDYADLNWHGDGPNKAMSMKGEIDRFLASPEAWS